MHADDSLLMNRNCSTVVYNGSHKTALMHFLCIIVKANAAVVYVTANVVSFSFTYDTCNTLVHSDIIVH